MIYRLVTRVIQYFCFPERPMKDGDILDFQKGGDPRKGRLDLEKGGMNPYQLRVLNENEQVKLITYTNKRLTILNKIKSINCSILQSSDVAVTNNTIILNSTIEYIISTQRLEGSI